MNDEFKKNRIRSSRRSLLGVLRSTFDVRRSMFVPFLLLFPYLLFAASTNNPALTSTNPTHSVTVTTNGVLLRPPGFFTTNRTLIGTGLGITNKGDLVAGTGSNIAVRTVGTQGQVLTADTNSPTGLSWLQGGAGSVTNVGLAADTNIYSVSGSPITNTGTLTLNMATQTVGTAMMSPATSNGVPTFRRLAATDLPGGINSTNIGNGAISNEEFQYLDGLATNLTVSLSNKIDAATMTSKGDLIGFSGTTPTRVPAGVNGQLLSVDMSTASGLRFVSASGVGTVTSIGVTAPAQFGVSNSPVTSSGTITITNAHQAANTLWAGPPSGSPAGPTFRTMEVADLPANIPWDKIYTGLVDTNEFSFLEGVTGPIQNQLDSKLTVTAGSGNINNLTASNLLISLGTLTLGGTEAGNPAFTIIGTSNLYAARYGSGMLNSINLHANTVFIPSPGLLSASKILINTTNNVNSLNVNGSGTFNSGYLHVYKNGITDYSNGQLIALEESGSTYLGRLSLGFSSGSDFGFIQATDPGVAVRNVVLQPSGGSVGIGTNTPAATLHVNGTARFEGAVLIANTITTNLQILVPGPGTNTLYITNGLVMKITNP